MASTPGTPDPRHAGYALAPCLAVGTGGFMAITGEGVRDALDRTAVTVYTAGTVAPPETAAAKAFTLFPIVWGVAIFLYVFGLVIELTVRGELGAVEELFAPRATVAP